MLAFTPEVCQSFQEIFLASRLSGKRNGHTWVVCAQDVVYR